MKLKTHKTTAKKIKITGGKRRKKMLTRKAGQDHFNARESGNTKRNKRRLQGVDKTSQKTLKNLLPYS